MSPEELIKKLNAANLAYSKGMPFMTDSEYDILWKELHRYDPTNKVLYHTANNPNLPYDVLEHKFQIFGTQKAFNMDDLKPFLQRFGSETLILEPKYDGCAAILYLGPEPEEDKLILEGNGLSGQDVSHHLEKIFCDFEPRHMESVEIIIPTTGWDEKLGANPRNTVAGWIARKELPHQNLVEIVSHNNGALKKEYSFTGDQDHLEETLLMCYNEWSKLYPLDGIMIKVLDEQRRIISSHNGTAYNWSIAWKPPIQTTKTKVMQIEWNVSRTGRVIPTVIYEPVKLCGTINSRVTANNAHWLIEKGIRVDSTITVGKAGEIIPKILAVSGPDVPFNDGLETSGVTVPTNTQTALKTDIPLTCPVCSNELITNGVDLLCIANDCIAQLTKSIAYFYSDKGIEVKTIGEYRIADILQSYLVRETLKKKPWALLDPIEYDIYYEIFQAWGNKRTYAYMESLHQIKGKKNAIHFIAALGLPGLAYKSALKLFNFIKTGKLKSNVSRKAQESFITAFATYQIAEKEMNNFQFDLVPQPSEISYCITGTLTHSRNDTIEYLTKQGWEFSNQVSKYTDYLIVGESPGGTKMAKAKELGTKIITEDQMNEFLNK